MGRWDAGGGRAATNARRICHPKGSTSSRVMTCRVMSPLRPTHATGVGMASNSESRQDQVQVAELVPAVAVLERSVVGTLEELGAGCGLEQLEVRGLRLVPAGEQAVDRE